MVFGKKCILFDIYFSYIHPPYILGLKNIFSLVSAIKNYSIHEKAIFQSRNYPEVYLVESDFPDFKNLRIISCNFAL